MSATITMRRTYRFRLEPTTSQEEGFTRFAGARRWVWNWALQQRHEHYAATGKGLPEKDLSARLTVLKAEPATAWLKDTEMPDAPVPTPAPERTVSVDLGLKDAVVMSDGERVAVPRFYQAAIDY